VKIAQYIRFSSIAEQVENIAEQVEGYFEPMKL
jgi:hypothetical protein